MQTELGYWVGTAAGIFGVLVAYIITKAATLKGHEACQPEEPFPYDETCVEDESEYDPLCSVPTIEGELSLLEDRYGPNATRCLRQMQIEFEAMTKERDQYERLEWLKEIEG